MAFLGIGDHGSTEIYMPHILADLATNSTNKTESSNADESVTGIFFTLTTVSISCNIFTLLLSSLLIFNLAKKAWNAKKLRERKRRRMYVYSMLFVSLIFV